MTEDEAASQVISWWLKMSDEALVSAAAEADAGRLSFAVNRAYYACFYALSAVLLAEGWRFAKHSGVRAALHSDLVRSGRLDPSWGRAYDRLFENRQRADYQELVAFEAEQVGELCGLALGFVAEMRRLVLRA